MTWSFDHGTQCQVEPTLGQDAGRISPVDFLARGKDAPKKPCKVGLVGLQISFGGDSRSPSALLPFGGRVLLLR